MTTPRYGRLSLIQWPRNFRPETNPAKVLRERRRPVLANVRGEGPTMLRDQLDPARRRLFDAQLAAFLAAEELTHFTTLNSKYGLPLVEHDMYQRWESARDEWEFEREAAADRATTITITEESRSL